MNRRDFFKYIMGGLSFLLVPSLSVAATKDRLTRPHDIVGATRFIERGLTPHPVRSTFYDNERSITGFGLASSSSTTDAPIRPYGHYLIHSNPETTERAAWSGFWEDYDRRISSEPRTDIYWRRNVEVVVPHDFSGGSQRYVVRGRFSLG